jgi:hypothetical protein
MKSAVLEKGGPGFSGRPSPTRMPKSGHYGLSVKRGSAHHTYNYDEEYYFKHGSVHIAMAVWGHGAGSLGGRTGIDIHLGNSFKWSIGCFVLVPDGEVIFDHDARSPRIETLHDSFNVVREFIKNIKEFDEKNNKISWPRGEGRIKCLYFIVDETNLNEEKDLTPPKKEPKINSKIKARRK